MLSKLTDLSEIYTIFSEFANFITLVSNLSTLFLIVQELGQLIALNGLRLVVDLCEPLAEFS